MPSASAAPQAQTGSHSWKEVAVQQNGYLCVLHCTACRERLCKYCCARPAHKYQIGLRQSHVTSWAIRDTYTASYIQSARMNLQVTCAGGNVTGGKMSAGIRAEIEGMLLQQSWSTAH